MEESLSVLIVDDSRIMRRMVARSLALSGVTLREIHEASDGRQALALLEVTQVDVVFVDVNMPIMGGIEMIEAMVKMEKIAHTPVVIVSTERSEARMLRLRNLGVRAYIHKPFTPEQFRAALFDVLCLPVAS